MGSELSQSQQIRNIFSASQYKVVQQDKSFPNLTIFRKISNSSNVALLVTNQSQLEEKSCSSDHVLKIIDRKKIGKNNLEVYEWANTNVNGLVDYITHIDKTRSISKSQFSAILEGAVRGYSAISEQVSLNDCLHIDMKNLRIFHSIQLKNDQQNRKEIVDYLHIKVVPLKITKSLNEQQNKSPNWSKIGPCIHKGGIHTQKQLLGNYLMKLTEYVSKNQFSNTKDSLINISEMFGTKVSKTIKGLLQNQSWKKVLQILDSPETEEILPLKLNSKQNSSYSVLNSKESLSTNRVETQKQVSIQRIQSQKTLFRCFEKQTKNDPTKTIDPPMQYSKCKRLDIDSKILNEKNMNSNQQDKNQKIETEKTIKNNYLFEMRQKSPQINRILPSTMKNIKQNVEPLKLTPTRNIKEVVSAQKPKINQNNFSPRLTRTNSILTIYPDVFRNQTQNRGRILSTKVIENVIKSPQIIKQTPKNFNSPSKQNLSRLILKEAASSNKKKIPQFQRCKGKPISFETSQINPTLNTIQISPYQIKTFSDTNASCQKISQQKTSNNNLKIK